jgi:ferredoxin
MMEEAAMKVSVDWDLCESNAICMGVVPEVFEVRDDDNLYVLQPEPPAELHERLRHTVRLCPKLAISLQE